MEDVILKYDDTLNNWRNTFKEALDNAGIVNDETMLSSMVRSLNLALKTYLTNMGYRPNATYSYRKGLTQRLKTHGLKINIKTNYIFWKYLEYFTDVEDYSNCFDISIDIENIEVATKDMLFFAVNIDQPKGVVQQPIHCIEYTEVRNKLDFVKTLVEKSADERIIKDMLDHIIDILDYIIRRTD